MHLSLCIRLSGSHGERRSAHPTPPEPLDPEAGKEELLSALLAPDLVGRTDQTRQSPNRRTFPVEAAVLLHEPAPQTIADIVVERRKELARSGKETVEVAQPRHDILVRVETHKRHARRSPRRSVPEDA